MAIVIGSGPNGLAAAIVLARAGLRVQVLEAQEGMGGCARSGSLTLPGFVHDLCSAVHPMAVASPCFRRMPLARHGLEWIQPPLAMAHPMDDGTAVVLARDLATTCEGLGGDGAAYRELMKPLAENFSGLIHDILGPVRFPKEPRTLMRFGFPALRSARGLAGASFQGERARALFAGLAAHSVLPLEFAGSAAFGLVLGAVAHAEGWPMPRGGAQSISNALAAYLAALGGEVRTGARVRSVDDLPEGIVLCDLTPRPLVEIAGHRFTAAYREKLARYRYGPGAYKVDWALDGPIPWRAKECAQAGTVHLGGTLEEISASEEAPWRGGHAERPFLILAQPSLFDPTRAPEGKHTAWAYCHVPNGSAFPMLERMEAQIERFAPGFGERVLARSVSAPADLERRNQNLVGGDLNGGAAVLGQLFLRPTIGMYSTPCRGLYICSAATPPGGGVHGMCGYFAAWRALRDCG